MKAYSMDLREKIVAAHIQEKISIRKVAIIFDVSKSLVQKLVKQEQVDGNLQPKPRGKPQFSHLILFLCEAAPNSFKLLSWRSWWYPNL
ncbi:hypothetical protein H6G95_30205 [Nostoc linckia FACHB-391]|uniref:Transposase Synechocystis PCC 6803 domain-containing protein n=1 Tax=Nostoc linckia FACHB-391 TaxID=2692906 RepID=A0ABR8F3N4_NOSLI|nr:hypothetical protein [Nostoc linckia FACHB-391]